MRNNNALTLLTFALFNLSNDFSSDGWMDRIKDFPISSIAHSLNTKYRVVILILKITDLVLEVGMVGVSQLKAPSEKS